MAAVGALRTSQGQDSIGINYGRVADNLPQADQVVKLLQARSVRHVRIYDTDATVLSAFANSGIDLGVTIPNANVSGIAASKAAADQWVQSQIQPFSSTNITSVAVGNEYLADPSLDPSQLLPAIQNIRQSLKTANLASIAVSTPHSFNNLIDPPGFPPSSGSFNPSLAAVVTDILSFLAQENAPFMVNLYPFFSYRDNSGKIQLQYALGETNGTVTPVGDSGNGKQYVRLFDAMVDTVVAAMARAGFGDVAVVVTESGWASGPDGEVAATVANAQTYNGNLVKHVLGGDGTPVRPGSGRIPTFIFALFDEDQKAAGVEQHFGLYHADQTPVYDVQLTSATTVSRSR